MDMLLHALLARRLVHACGGVDLVVANRVLTRNLQASRLRDFGNPNNPSVMPADVIVDLEAYCGQPIYSRRMVQARPAAPEPVDALSEACEVVGDAAQLLALTKAVIDKHRGATTLDVSAAQGLVLSMTEALGEWVAGLAVRSADAAAAVRL